MAELMYLRTIITGIVIVVYLLGFLIGATYMNKINKNG